MAWTDQCKYEAVRAVDHKVEQGMPVREALKKISKESDIPAKTLERWKYPPKKTILKNEDKPLSDIEQIYKKLHSLERFLKKKGIEKRYSGGTYIYNGDRVEDGPPERCETDDSKIAWKATILLSNIESDLRSHLSALIPKKPEKIIPPASEVTADDFEEKVSKSKDPVLVDFYQPDCRPCRDLSPTIDKLSEQYASKKRKPVKIFKCKDPKIINSLQIEFVPHLSFYKNGVRNDVEASVRTLKDIKVEITQMIKDAA